MKSLYHISSEVKCELKPNSKIAACHLIHTFGGIWPKSTFEVKMQQISTASSPYTSVRVKYGNKSVLWETSSDYK